ncbi:ribosome maturation factor RimM [Dendrosporobacter sp. 1207_IL3150]|uniref:ribosome maturation factor RimM n=1 Tax=Dendrosporobacter sp. 1207_IL3150 TaxID=3084054 RepID=UPI002FD9197C
MEQLLVVGKIVAPHGVRGEVRVIPLTDFPERFSKLKSVFLDDGSTLDIEYAKTHNQGITIKFSGLNDRNDIEHLRGKLLKIAKKDAVKLPKGEYYTFEIIGLKVYDDAGQYIGKITEVLKTGSNDVYVAEQEDKRQVLIPALKKVVTNIDIEGGQMTVKLQEEWE